MRPKSSPFVLDALHADMAPVVVDRVRAVLVLAAVSTAMSTVVDLFGTAPDIASILFTKLGATCLYGCGAILVTAARGREWRRMLAVVVPSACLLTVVPGVIGLALQDP